MDTIAKGPEVWDKAYNIATHAVVTLEAFIQKVANLMNVTILETDPNDNNLHMYPTVFTGGISVERAEKLLNFKPTTLEDALSATISWYDNEFTQSYDYRESMISDIMARIVPRERRDKLYMAVDRELSKVGIKEPNYRAKRKGDLETLEKFERTTKVKKQEL
jgi:hypothetical protein